MTQIYDFKVKDNKGREFDFSTLRGKVILVVNTASKCGFTPQYKALEALYQEYKDRGLVVVGFPCNQFGGQEPGSASEIAEFCELNFGVTFPLMEKVDVNGTQETPVFTYLKRRAGGWFGRRIKWNFTKFLLSRDGQKVVRYSPITKPEKLRAQIEAFLEAQG